jgi:type VI protein secretion system component Hcp
MKNILITLFACISIAANAQTYLIRIGALKGDSQIIGFKGSDGWSEIYVFNLDITGNLQFNNTGFGPAPGKAECGMIEIVKNYNYQGSNEISKALHVGTKFQIEIVGLKNNPSGPGIIEFIRYTFTDSIFSKFNKSVSTTSGDAVLREDIGFKAVTFKIEYKDVSPVLTFGWNFLTNTPL